MQWKGGRKVTVAGCQEKLMRYEKCCVGGVFGCSLLIQRMNERMEEKLKLSECITVFLHSSALLIPKLKNPSA